MYCSRAVEFSNQGVLDNRKENNSDIISKHQECRICFEAILPSAPSSLNNRFPVYCSVQSENNQHLVIASCSSCVSLSANRWLKQEKNRAPHCVVCQKPYSYSVLLSLLKLKQLLKFSENKNLVKKLEKKDRKILVDNILDGMKSEPTEFKKLLLKGKFNLIHFLDRESSCALNDIAKASLNNLSPQETQTILLQIVGAAQATNILKSKPLADCICDNLTSSLRKYRSEISLEKILKALAISSLQSTENVRVESILSLAAQGYYLKDFMSISKKFLKELTMLTLTPSGSHFIANYESKEIQAVGEALKLSIKGFEKSLKNFLREKDNMSELKREENFQVIISCYNDADQLTPLSKEAWKKLAIQSTDQITMIRAYAALVKDGSRLKGKLKTHGKSLLQKQSLGRSPVSRELPISTIAILYCYYGKKSIGVGLLLGSRQVLHDLLLEKMNNYLKRHLLALKLKDQRTDQDLDLLKYLIQNDPKRLGKAVKNNFNVNPSASQTP